MKVHASTILLVTAIATVLFASSAVPLQAAEPPTPFGFAVGVFNYEETLKLLADKRWPYMEYEKKQFKTVAPTSPQRGTNTFLRVTPRKMDGIKGILMFFGPKQTLQAVLINLEPQLFTAIMTDLDAKYTLVRKKLQGESYTSEHPYVLYEKGDVYIELQMYGPHRVRLLYTEKYMWANYREFLQKDYEPFRNRLDRETWMQDL